MQSIQLAGDETITVIRNLLEHAAEKDVLVVIPRGCRALEKNLVNLAVLRRWADNLALRLAVVADDWETRSMASEAGLVVLRSPEAATSVPARQFRRRHRGHQGLPARPGNGSILNHAPQRLERTQRNAPAVKGYSGLLVAGATFAVLAFTLLFVLPSATITLRMVGEPVAAEMDITAVAGLTEIDYGQAKVPARTVSVELVATDTMAATERRDVPDGHAEGSVVFANKTTIGVTITKGTVVRTSHGENVRFYTVADVWLPGELHGTVRTGILAAEAGPGGNVPALTVNIIEGELAAQVDVLNDSRTSGGTVRRMAVVAGDDKVRLRAKLMKSIQADAYEKLISSLGPGEFIPPESLAVAVTEEEFDHSVGEMVDQLGMSIKVSVTGLAASGRDAEQVMLRLLEQRTAPQRRLVAETAKFERGSLIRATAESASFHITARGQSIPRTSDTLIGSAVAGKNVQQAQQWLSHQFTLAAEPKIQLSGSVLGRLPWWSARVRVEATTG